MSETENQPELSSGQKAWFTRELNDFRDDIKKEMVDVRKDKQEVLDELMGAKKVIVDGSDDVEALLERAKDAVDEIRVLKKETEGLVQRIFTPNPRTRKTLAQTIADYADEFDKEHSVITQSIESIREFEEEVAGGKDDDGEPIEGIKQRMKAKETEFSSLHTSHDKEQKKLFKKIESLLQGASTVALAKSFKEHKDSFDNVNKWWIRAFIACIILMMAASSFAFFKADYKVEEMWKYTLGMLPVLGGAIWMAIYATKQRSQNKRLQQEYAFKEDVAKIYYGLKTEIDELGNKELGEKLKERILEVILEVVAMNPSATLESKVHNDKGPILEMLKDIRKTVKKTKGLDS